MNKDLMKSYQINYQILLQEVQEYKQELWERNRFCSCDADNVYECSCAAEKKKRFVRRRKRKVNKKFDNRIEAVLKRDVNTLCGIE